MLLTQSPKINLNYAARLVRIEEFFEHPNPKCERLKCCKVGGFTIAVSKDTQPGVFVYFPTECAINGEYLSKNNLYRDSNKNVDHTQKGFFEDNGRVKAIKLQGFPSEGLLMPLSSLETIAKNPIDEVIFIEIGKDFDTFEDTLLCKKYIPKNTRTPGQPNGGKVTKKLKKHIQRILPEQFRFHYDTTLIKKCPFVIKPDSLISITEKVHGTSAISSYVLCKNEYNKRSKFGVKLVNFWYKLSRNPFTHRLSESSYADIYSSRSVIKDPEYNPEVGEGWYGKGDDIMRKMAHDKVMEKLSKGMTAYYEIIGYTADGKCIQKNYDYGFTPATGEEVYTLGKHFDIQIYRLTYTNPDGEVFEFSARQVQQWCERNELTPVKEYYYGYAKDLYPDLDLTNHWNDNFITRLANDKNFYMEELSPTCANKVPHEGVVIKIENFLSQAFKLKCNRFLEGETKALDAGEADLETES